MICAKTIQLDNHVLDVKINNDIFVSRQNRDNNIYLWSLTGNLIKTLEHSNWVVCIATRGNFIVSGSYFKFYIWSLDGTLVKIVEDEDWISHIDLNNDVVITESNQTIKIWSLDGSLIKALERQTSWIRSIYINDDVIISNQQDSTIKIWSLTEFTFNTFNIPIWFNGVLYNGLYDEKINIWTLDNKKVNILSLDGTLIKTLNTPNTNSVLLVTSFNDIIILGAWCTDENIIMYKNGKLLCSLKHVYISSFALNDDFMITGSEDNTIKIWITNLNYYKKLRKVLSKKQNVLNNMPDDIIYVLAKY